MYKQINKYVALIWTFGVVTSIIGTVGRNRRKRSRCFAVVTSTRAVLNAMHFNGRDNEREYIGQGQKECKLLSLLLHYVLSSVGDEKIKQKVGGFSMQKLRVQITCVSDA